MSMIWFDFCRRRQVLRFYRRIAQDLLPSKSVPLICRRMKDVAMSWLSGLESVVRKDEPLAAHTWLSLGGPAAYFAQPNTWDELSLLVNRCREEDIPLRLLGGGSNVLVREKRIEGVVVHLEQGEFVQVDTKNDSLWAGGGAKLGHVISTAVGAGLSGLEVLVGIPGTIGGALHSNAGTRGGDIGQWTVKAKVMTRSGNIIERQKNEMVFAYRQSSLDELVILQAEFRLEQANPDELTKRMQKQWIIRKASQPLGHQKAACIFKNPRGMSAGMLIDQSDLKGTRIGCAEVSDRHANFIVTEEGATSDDVLALIDLIRERVAERMGITLEPEIEIW